MPKISEARRAARRAQILHAARACFLRQGLHGTTMDDIIAASGLSAGAVYAYFPGKEALIMAAVTGGLAELRALLVPLLIADPPPPPAGLVRQLADAIARFAAREGYDLRRLALLGWSEAQHNPQLGVAMQGFYAAFRAELAAAASAWRKAGLVDPAIPPDDIATALLALLMGFVAQAALLGDIEPAAIARGAAAFGRSASAPSTQPGKSPS